MNHSVLVKIQKSFNDLLRVIHHFKLMQSLSSSKQLIETLILTNLKENVNTFQILKIMLESNHMFVV